MAAFLGGKLTQRGYTLLLRNLEPIYRELEAALGCHATHPGIEPLIHPRMFRLPALHRDLETLHGSCWRDELEFLDSSTAYATRLRHLADFQPELLAAHAYVRYLGDLSGGQMLAGIVARSLTLPNLDGTYTGTDFYDFGGTDEVSKLTAAFRSGLDTLPADGIVAEARLAFELHGQLFDDLANCCGLRAAIVTGPD